MKRRAFIQSAIGLAMASRYSHANLEDAQGKIMTVNGLIDPGELGMTLTHEHVLVDFIGADKASPDRYEQDDAFNKALPFLKQAKDFGCNTLAECTPAYIGRDARLCQRLSSASGLHILTNTGYYGAAGDKFIPAHAYQDGVLKMADRWILECRNGIDGTAIRPGFIKIGVDSGPLSDIDSQLVHAAAITHAATGLTIASHTGPGEPALAQIEILKIEGVSPRAWIWVHAQNEKDTAVYLQAAKEGAWISLDGASKENTQAYIEKINAIKAGGYLDQVLLSHDAGWYRPGEPDGGEFRSYEDLFTHLIPGLKQAGYTDGEIKQLTVDNPKKAFTIRKRSL